MRTARYMAYAMCATRCGSSKAKQRDLTSQGPAGQGARCKSSENLRSGIMRACAFRMVRCWRRRARRLYARR